MLRRTLFAAGMLIAATTLVSAQPVHMPGTVCFTAINWCWLAVPEQPGGPCSCPSSVGWVAGTAG